MRRAQSISATSAAAASEIDKSIGLPPPGLPGTRGTSAGVAVAVGRVVGATVAVGEGASVGVGVVVGAAVGVGVGVVVGAAVGVGVGVAVGAAVGVGVGVAVGAAVGVGVGVAVGAAVGVGVGVLVGMKIVGNGGVGMNGVGMKIVGNGGVGMKIVGVGTAKQPGSAGFIMQQTMSPGVHMPCAAAGLPETRNPEAATSPATSNRSPRKCFM